MTDLLKATELPPAFDPASVEAGLYNWWDSQGYFAPIDDPEAEPFVIIMPPPNVTGELHVGHALFVALQDLMIRWRRMQGYSALWLPGADHAGIAGQWVVEKILATEGLTRHDLGRERFAQRVWEYMDPMRWRIREQMMILGASCDWSRLAFTMDPQPSRAVRKVFKHLYDKGLIYRGSRLISWCPRCMTALSDLEVVHKDVPGHLWQLAYPVAGDPDREIIVATTRPETMLGDTAVAVHPGDARYSDLIGKQVRLPITNRLIPIVADDAVDMAFGTGAVKVTPAHDPNDFEIGRRNNLPAINIMNPNGTINAEGGPFEGMTVPAARDAVVNRLQQDGFIRGITEHSHPVGHCDRCGTVVEPLISEQWFVKMDDLAAPAIAAAKDGSLTFVPDRFKGVYLNWMENIHDWCISRQLWWGHRIPVWYCQDCGKLTVSEEETVDACSYCGGPVIQDEDVLDTWFSSGLWPFSTLGWPDQTEDLERYYPSDVMETGYEILFFWVARMVFFGLEMMGELPFHTVYLHGTVRDAVGAKMSKTKGNVLDPTELTATYGADALRYALLTQSGPGQDSKLHVGQIEAARNFINKVWNATRFATRIFDETPVELDADGPISPDSDALVDRWIVSRTNAVIAETNDLLEKFAFLEAGRGLRDFIWSELCDWYIEAAKVRLRGTEVERRQVAQTLAWVLERSLRLLHPMMPFASEAMWQAIPHSGESVMVARWPRPAERDLEAERDWDRIMELVTRVRNIRSESNVEPGRWITAAVYAPDGRTASVEAARRELASLARIADDQLTISGGDPVAEQGDVVVAAGDLVAVLPLSGLVDLAAERERLSKELEEAVAERGRAEAQLGNESFIARAPDKVVQVQRDRLAGALERIALLERRLTEVGG
ncbi:MAG TPA: valine--tRNA ligase [Thermomicrobiales bacterium]|nr:valine--tRNA ligase [Thermomicrobiales bacterium]